MSAARAKKTREMESYLRGAYQSIKVSHAQALERKEVEAALGQRLEVPAEFLEFVEALGCKCVNLKCQCTTENGTLPATLEKLATFLHHRTVIQKKPIKHKFVHKSHNTRQQSPLRVETLATALGCECVNSQCQCVAEEGPDSSAALNDLMAFLDQMNTSMLEEEAVFQESVTAKMRRFFHDGFERLKQTFTRRPH